MINDTSTKPALAVDLIDTLIKRGKETFSSKCAILLQEKGLDISEESFYLEYRKRYIEYSFGNYISDWDYFSVLFSEYPTIDVEEIMPTIMNIRYESSPPFDEASYFLKCASEKFRVVLASNYVLSWAQHIVEANFWQDYFSHLLVSSECGFRKPAYGFFEQLISLSGAESPSEIIFVGDSFTNDVYGGSRAGLRVFHLDRTNASDQHHKYNNVESVSSLMELLSTIQ